MDISFWFYLSSGLFLGWSLGASDAANIFGTAVGTKMVKFRTMRTTGIPFDINNPVIEDDNQNLTKVGRFIRRFKLDEFLQLFNVLKGDMNFIGPRPLLPVYLEQYQPWEKEKFKLKPGMSGLAQVNGNGHLSGAERSYYDVLYIKKENPFTDLGIVFKTLLVVLRGEEKYLRHVSEKELNLISEEFETTGKISRKGRFVCFSYMGYGER